MQSLTERLKVARELAGLTQKMLSAKTGISLRALQSYEKDASKISFDKVLIIAHTCKVDENWFLTGKGEPVPVEGSEKTEQKPQTNDSEHYKNVVDDMKWLNNSLKDEIQRKDKEIERLFEENKRLREEISSYKNQLEDFNEKNCKKTSPDRKQYLLFSL